MLDDDTAHVLALLAGLEWPKDDRALLAPLIDATIVWMDDAELDRIAAPIVEALWADGLSGAIERALEAYEERHDVVPGARADLARGPAKSRLALAYVKQGAIDLSGHPFVFGRCLCCVEDGLGSVAPPVRDEIAVRAAVAIVRHAQAGFGVGEPTGKARRDATKRLRELAVLAEHSLPHLAAAPDDLAATPDRLWSAAKAELY